MPILYDFTSVPSRKRSMRNAGMFTMMRVSCGTAFGPGNIVGATFSAVFSGVAGCVCASAVVIGEAGDDVPCWHEIVASAPMIPTIMIVVRDFMSGDLNLFAQDRKSTRL